MDLGMSEELDYTTVYVKNPDDNQVTEVLVPSSLPVDALPGNLSEVIEALNSDNVKTEDSVTFNLIHDPRAHNEQLNIELTVNDPHHAEYSEFIHYKFDLVCQSCEFSAKSYSTLVEHVKECIAKLKSSEEIVNDDDNITLQCKWCPQTQFHSLTDFQIHSQCHSVSSDGNMTCCICAQDAVASFRDTHNWAQLRSHLNKAHSVNFYLQCPTCDNVFESHSALKKHMSTHNIPCELCDYCADDQNMLNLHTLCHDCDNAELFKCLVCYKGFTDWTQTLEHLEDCHRGICNHRHQCVNCCRGFDTKQELNSHCETCFDVPSAESTVSCVVCKADIALSFYVSHFIQCIEDRAEEIMALEPPDESLASMNLRTRTSFRCAVHAMSFPTRELYLRHLVQSHAQIEANLDDMLTDNVPDACTTDAAFVPESSDIDVIAATKIETVTEDNDSQATKCSLCYKKFTTPARLQKHFSKVHTEAKQQPVQCEVCSKFFKSGVRLRNHVREVHEGLKRKPKPKPAEKIIHVCETCGYVTPCKDRLKNHQLSVHEGILPFKCKLCPYRTSERADLVRHKYKHTDEKRYHCPTCSYSTNERWVLVNHCSKQHGIEMPKMSRNTRGLHGSLNWQQSTQRQRRRQIVDPMDNTELSNLTAQFKFDAQQELEDNKEPLTFFVDPETASEMLMVSAEEITQ